MNASLAYYGLYHLRDLRNQIGRGELLEDNSLEIFFTTHLSDGTEVALKPNGATIRVEPVSP